MRLEEAIIIIQQLTKENSLDQEDSDDQSDKSYAITEELLRVSSQLPNVRWDSIDMGNLTLSASLKGPWGKDGADIFIKIKIDIPTEYPELKAPKFVIEKSPSIPEETHKRLDRELYELAEQFVQKKQNCLETIFTYLLGEVDFESATPFSKNNRHLIDDNSTEEDDGIQVGGSASMSQELPPADEDPDESVPSLLARTPNTDFEIVIICTLLTVYDAICLILDEVWDKDSKRNEQDHNSYTTGRVGRHNVVIALLLYTRNPNAAVANMTHFRFRNSEIALLLNVGICGGVPKFHRGEEEVEILLGDVVISKGDVVLSNGAAQLEFGRTGRWNRRFESINSLYINHRDSENRAKYALREVSRFDPTYLRLKMHQILFELQSKETTSGNILGETKYKYRNPGAIKERLFGAHYIHKHRIAANDCSVCNVGLDDFCSDARKASCQEIGCDERQLVLRKTVRGAHMPMIQFGRMASADIVLMNGLERDRISDQERVIAFDRDGLGGWDNFPHISIKGVCDYADGHKDDSWQNYAAATAAAAAKAFLVKLDDSYVFATEMDFE